MKNTILFSIIMPFFNSELYIYDSIYSVIIQSYKNWELIMVNDGSTDKSIEIVESFNDQRIHIITKNNGGYATAINKGLEFVKGDYLILMGSDDLLEKNLLLTLEKNISNKKPDIVNFRTQFFYKTGAYHDDNWTLFQNYVFEERTNLKVFEKNNPRNARILTDRDTSKCYKLSLLKGLKYTGTTGLDSDSIFAMMFADRCSSFMSIPYIGYYWRLRSNSVSARPLGKYEIIDKINNWLFFFNYVLNSDQNNFSKREWEKLYYFLNILKKTSESIFFVICNYWLIKKGIYYIKKLKNPYTKYHINDQLFLHCPLFFSICKKTKRLLSKR